jgi:ubiquinone/menaquinone biosynthesis C-methylase UbiE
MEIYPILLNNYSEIIKDLSSKGILTHSSFPAVDSHLLDYLSLLVYFEQYRRGLQTLSLPRKVEDFEKAYNGIEVGALRRYFNSVLEKESDFSLPLLDIGCGGAWWKEGYWTKFPKVHAVEVNPYALLQVRDEFNDKERYNLVFSTTGLTEYDDNSFSQILSSSVIGYITPIAAEVHLKECWRLLQKGGTLILTRINAYRIENILRGPMRESGIGTYDYAYTTKKFLRLIKKTCCGCQITKYMKIGVRPPKLPLKFIQHLYTYDTIRSIDRYINRIPLIGIHHFACVRKI